MTSLCIYKGQQVRKTTIFTHTSGLYSGARNGLVYTLCTCARVIFPFRHLHNIETPLNDFIWLKNNKKTWVKVSSTYDYTVSILCEVTVSSSLNATKNAQIWCSKKKGINTAIVLSSPAGDVFDNMFQAEVCNGLILSFWNSLTEGFERREPNAFDALI